MTSLFLTLHPHSRRRSRDGRVSPPCLLIIGDDKSLTHPYTLSDHFGRRQVSSPQLVPSFWKAVLPHTLSPYSGKRQVSPPASSLLERTRLSPTPYPLTLGHSSSRPCSLALEIACLCPTPVAAPMGDGSPRPCLLTLENGSPPSCPLTKGDGKSILPPCLLTLGHGSPHFLTLGDGKALPYPTPHFLRDSLPPLPIVFYQEYLVLTHSCPIQWILLAS